jgi:hypothetical protein
MTVEVGGSEFDPRATEGLLIVKGVAGELRRSKLGELDAECTSISKRNEEYRMRKPKVEFAHVATKHISEERGELFASPRLDEEMHTRAKSYDRGVPRCFGHGQTSTYVTDFKSYSTAGCLAGCCHGWPCGGHAPARES